MATAGGEGKGVPAPRSCSQRCKRRGELWEEPPHFVHIRLPMRVPKPSGV